MSARKKEKVSVEQWFQWQNILIFKDPFKIREEEKILPTNWIKRNDNLKRSIMNWGISL